MTYSIKQALFDPFSKGAYLLASDGTNSAIWNTTDIYAAVRNWLKGANIAGVYNVLRAGNAAGTVLSYVPNTSTVSPWTETFNFLTGTYGWAGSTSVSQLTTWALGVGWTGATVGALDRAFIYRSFASTTITSITIYANTTVSASDGFVEYKANATSCTAPVVTVAHPMTGSSWSYAPGVALTGFCIGWERGGGGTSAIANIVKIVVTGTGTNPFGSSGNAAVRTSYDYGATWTIEQTVGTSPGSVGGFDVQLAGTVSYAAMAAKVRKATTLDGAYADFINTTGANAVCIIVPWYTRNSTTAKNTTGANPDCLVALDAPDSDGGTLYWVAGATGVKTDITPAAGVTFNSANCITTSYGTHIAVIGIKAGVYHLYTSINGGGAWTDQGTLTTPHFIRGRRKDTRAKAGGNTGQIYVTNGNPIDYSRDWGVTEYPRTMPVTGVLGFDIAG